jgi:hypothetical protein
VPSLFPQRRAIIWVVHPLDGPILKLQRAEAHLQTLNREVARFLEGHPYHAFIDFDSHDIQVKGNVLYPPPTECATVIGDTLHNFRSALDHLAWQLVIAGGGTPDTNTEFPIFIDRAEFWAVDKSKRPKRGGGLLKIDGMSDAAKAIIESKQPYQGRDWPPERHPLWLLHRLSIEDKHHTLVVVGAATSAISLRVSASHTEIGRMQIGMRPFQDNGVIETFSADILAGLEGNPDIYLAAEPTFTVAFDPEGPGLGIEVTHLLAKIHEVIVELFFECKPLLRK